MAEEVIAPELLAQYIPLDGLRMQTRVQLAGKAHVQLAAKGVSLSKLGEPSTEATFVINGEVELRDAKDVLQIIVGGTPRSFHRLPGRVSARCLTPVRYLSIDASMLDALLTWDQSPAPEVGGTVEVGTDTQDWMTRLLQMPIFQSVPASNLQAMFMRMSEVKVGAGQVVIRQDDEGDYFYVVIDGRCAVTCAQAGHKPFKLAELDSGFCFGEDALLSNAPRNATITMLTSGVLMRLGKEDFRRLLKEPLMHRLPMSQAEAMVAGGGARWLDVRLPSEYQAHHLPGSVNIPLLTLRAKVRTLDKKLSYIVCCDTGRRSSVGVFVLAQKGLSAYLLDKGLPQNSGQGITS